MPHKQPETESEANEMLLDSYVTYIHNHICNRCTQIETFSQVFEVWLHPTKTRSTNLRDLRPLVGLALKPLNMAIVRAPTKIIPLCLHCAETYKVVGPAQTVTIHADTGSWQETLRRKYEAVPQEVKVAKTSASPTKTIPTLDQI